VCEGQGQTDVRPPDVDVLTHDDEGPDDVIGIVDVRMYQGHLKHVVCPRKHAKIWSKLIYCLQQLVKYRSRNRLRNVVS
jgi:hypothetical protein